MTPKELSRLFKKYQDGTLSPAEKSRLDDWYMREAANSPARLSDEEMAELSGRLRAGLPVAHPAKQRALWPRIAAAASILIALSAGGYFILHKQQPPQQIAQIQKQDISPGHNQATLTLANGQKIVLTKGLSGKLAVQNHTVISAAQNAITYDANNNKDQVSYNTLSTARGEQSPYPLVLPDGTKVWLNAESSITFPTTFNGRERLVKVTGEAYLEVVHNDKMPFRVQAGKETVNDVGTHFDINSYADEPGLKTTLVEGAVSIVAGKATVSLAPGQQALLHTDQFAISTVNTARVIAWKDGYFRFQRDDVQGIMRQLARWYNIDVNYAGDPPQDLFTGRISRSKNISAVLRMLEKTGEIHFKIEGRSVTVMK